MRAGERERGREGGEREGGGREGGRERGTAGEREGMGIMWPASKSHFHLLFIFIKIKFYSLSFLCDVCNEVHEHMQ